MVGRKTGMFFGVNAVFSSYPTWNLSDAITVARETVLSGLSPLLLKVRSKLDKKMALSWEMAAFVFFHSIIGAIHHANTRVILQFFSVAR